MRLLARGCLFVLLLSVVVVKPTAVDTQCTTPPIQVQTDPCTGTYTTFSLQQPITNLTVSTLLLGMGVICLLRISYQKQTGLDYIPVQEILHSPQTPPPRFS